MPYTPKKTVDAIINSGNHYVLQIKKNQWKLYHYIRNHCATNPAIETYQITEKTHGRHTTWRVKIYEIEDLVLQKTWTNLRRFILVEKTVVQKGKANTTQAKQVITTESISYRISDVTSLSAQEFAQGIRGHWGIENRTHWVKDVNFKEDNNKIKNDNGAVNMAIFNTISLNYLRQNIDDSIKNAQIIFGQNVKELFLTIRT
jgi:predicted transposase YbfD/YdcC